MLPEPDTYEKAQLVFVASYAQVHEGKTEGFEELEKLERAVDCLISNGGELKGIDFICATAERYPEMEEIVFRHRATRNCICEYIAFRLSNRRATMSQKMYDQINNLENAQVVAIEYCEKFCSQDEVRPNISERETAREAFNFIAQNDRDGSARNFFDTLTEQYPRFREELAYFLPAPKKHGRSEEGPEGRTGRSRMEEESRQMEIEEKIPTLESPVPRTPPPSPAPTAGLMPTGQRPANSRRHERDEDVEGNGRERLRRTGSPPPTPSREFSQASLGHLFLGFQGGPNPNPARPMGAFQPPQRQGFGMDR